MALKDVVQKIPLFKINSSGSLEINIDVEYIASCLGLNYKQLNATEYIVYLGDNDQNGILFANVSNNRLYNNLYCNGQIKKQDGQDYINMYCLSNNAYLYYVKTKDAVAFGMSDDGTIRLDWLCAESINILDGSKKYAYILGDFGSNYVSSDGYYSGVWAGDMENTSDFYAKFNKFCSHNGDVFKNVYMPDIFKSTNQSQFFTVNGKNYLSLYCSGVKTKRCIIEF